jgi:hypothetical protein
MAREVPKAPKVTADVNHAPDVGDDGPYSTTYNTNLTIEASALLGNDDGKDKGVLSTVEITSDRRDCHADQWRGAGGVQSQRYILGRGIFYLPGCK